MTSSIIAPCSRSAWAGKAPSVPLSTKEELRVDGTSGSCRVIEPTPHRAPGPRRAARQPGRAFGYDKGQQAQVERKPRHRNQAQVLCHIRGGTCSGIECRHGFEGYTEAAAETVPKRDDLALSRVGTLRRRAKPDIIHLPAPRRVQCGACQSLHARCSALGGKAWKRLFALFGQRCFGIDPEDPARWSVFSDSVPHCSRAGMRL
jgi:hypothetical protein